MRHRPGGQFLWACFCLSASLFFFRNSHILRINDMSFPAHCQKPNFSLCYWYYLTPIPVEKLDQVKHIYIHICIHIYLMIVLVIHRSKFLNSIKRLLLWHHMEVSIILWSKEFRLSNVVRKRWFVSNLIRYSFCIRKVIKIS